MSKIAILTMQKNESVILPMWVDYYSKIFGIENLFVFDNGSTIQEVKEYLNRIKLQGCNIIAADERSDFQNKGRLLLRKARELFLQGFDFAYFADADEFLIVVDNEVPQIKKEEILIKFDELVKAESAITRIGLGWFNIPNTSKLYLDKYGTQKVILRSDVSNEVDLDLGFHMYDWGQRRDIDLFGKFNPSAFGLLHFHNKPYSDYILFAKMKLEGRVDLNNLNELKKYNGAGSHLIEAIVNGEAAYYHSFESKINSSVDFLYLRNDIDFKMPYLVEG
jgi:hypothetical protein